MRILVGTLVGYLVFALPSFLLFRVTGHDPHAPATLGFEVATVLWGMLFALLGGYIGTAIAERGDLHVACYIAAILIAMASWSLLATGYSWSPVASIVCMAPAVLAGGWLRLRRQ